MALGQEGSDRADRHRGDPDRGDEYLLQLINLQPITDDVQAWLRIGTGGTPTWQAGASAYDTAGRQIVSTGGADFGGVAAQIELTRDRCPG